MERTKKAESLSVQVQRRASSKVETPENEGNFETIISTGSTLLDLTISGGRIRGGGIPGGVFVEIYGPESSGKTALLCEIGGNIEAKGGENQYHDPEGRIDTQFSQMFGIHINEENYYQPDTVPAVFKPIREWKPNGKGINGILVDSLAALSTDLEMDNEGGDKMGGRRGKEFSQELRKACRLLKQKNYIMLCSNQIRDTFATFGKKQDSPGGKAIRFYSSLRLETAIVSKIKKTKTINGKEVSRIVGVNIEIEVVKSSIWKPYRTAPLTIIFDYGIDDIRQNLQFIKDYTKSSVYTLGGNNLDKSLDVAIKKIEEGGLESQLREEVIDLWEYIEDHFTTKRKSKTKNHETNKE